MRVTDSNVFEYLETTVSAQPETLEALYAHAGACRCIFESLPPLAKQYVMRLVPCGEVWVELDSWLAEAGALAHHNLACTQLTKLRVMEKRKPGADQGRLEYKLHTRFREQMLEWLSGSEAGRWEKGPAPTEGKEDKVPSLEQLEAISSKKWESVLEYLLSGGKVVFVTRTAQIGL